MARVRERVGPFAQPFAVDDGDQRLAGGVLRAGHRMDVRGIGEQAVLDREGQQLADRGGAHLRELQPREEHALGGEDELHRGGARHLGHRRAALAHQLAARIEEHPRERRRGARALAGGCEDAQLHGCDRL
jgi:hypothetical protein